MRRRVRLLDEYAPPRPVRLLGVRVAGLSSADGAGAGGATAGTGERERGQLALPL